MNKLVIILAFMAHSVLIFGQRNSQDILLQIQNRNTEISQAFSDKDYVKLEKLLLEQKSLFSRLSKEDQQEYEDANASIDYNLACLYSLKKDKKKAVAFFEKAVNGGYDDYSNAKEDTDLDYIRNEPNFIKAINSIREFDFLYILQNAGSYQEDTRSDLPDFQYEDIRNWRIQAVKQSFNLDSIAGQGDEMSRIINILNWVHQSIRHDGSNWPVCEIDAIDIYHYAKTRNRGVNCRALAIVLNECYLSMGFKSRFITCLPKREDDPDCHVINCVYSTTFDKWVWMDPSFNAYLKDEEGNFLSIEEVRFRLINDLPIVLNDDANWNGKPTQKEWYVDTYMAKNLYWFQCPARSLFNVETRYRNSDQPYITLLPTGYARTNNISQNGVVTHDPDYFWQTPKREITATTMLTPAKMRKDIDFFFETLSKVHANMYAFVSKEEMAKIQEQLYRDCSVQMTAFEFNRRIMRLNKLFDGHTSIRFDNFWNKLNEYSDFFPLPVSFTDGKIYLLDDGATPEKRIISINGTKIEEIYNNMVNTNEIREAGEIRASASSRFASNLFINTDIRPPFHLVVEKNNAQETIVLDGVPLNSVKTMPSGFDNMKQLGFRMYPEKSIAIIDYNTCNFFQDSGNKWRLNHWFDEQFRLISEHKIKTLFIDISRNGGGNSANNNVLFKRIKLDQPIELEYMIQSRYHPYADDGQKELGHLASDTFKMVTPRNPNGFGGDIYLIQGPGSYSAAVGVAEWFQALDRAKLIGEQTGQATAVYIDTAPFSLPESQIGFGCSFKYWTSLPEGHEDKGVQPDYRVKLDYSKSYYDLNDLLGFLSQIDPKFKYQPVATPQGTKVAVKSATANYFQPGENIDKSLDGNMNTMYHSPWDGKIEFPVILTFDFEGVTQIDFFKYYPRANDPPNGLFGKVEIWASTKSDPVLKKIGTHDFYQSSAPAYCQFAKSLKNPTKIELRVLSAMSWHGDNHASCAEIEFYKK